MVNGKILTDAGELLTKLIEYNLPTGIGGPCARTGNVFALPVPVITYIRIGIRMIVTISRKMPFS
jgi:hypothetical protein